MLFVSPFWLTSSFRCAQKTFLRVLLHSFILLYGSILYNALKGILALEKQRVWEVREGWAGGDVQGESMLGFLTTMCVSNKAF